MKILLSVLLCIILAGATTLPSFATGTSVSREAGLHEESPHDLSNLPEGFHDTGTVYLSETGEKYYYLESDASASGWITPMWIDARGNEMDGSFEPFLGQTEVRTAPQRASIKAPALPAAYDARSEGLITPVKHQNSGTCWAFAAVAVMEANAVKKGLATSDTIDLSEYFLVRNSLYGYYPGVSDAANDGDAPASFFNALKTGGNYNYVARSVLNFSGAVNEANYPLAAAEYYVGGTNDGRTKIVEKDLWEHIFFNDKFDRDYVVTSIKTISKTQKSIKNAVLTYGACQISAHDIYERDEEAMDSSTTTPHPYFQEQTASYYRPTAESHGHAMVIVGWDDTYSRENFCEEYRPSADGAWLLKNSWGSNFGNGGYIWLSYEDPNIKNPVIYEVEAASEWQNVYLYDGRGSAGTVSAEAAANVFRTNNNELLTKVSDGAKSDTSQQYTFEIYALPENYSNPVDGTLLYTQTCMGNGTTFLTVDTPVELPAGQYFSVVFRGGSAYATEKKSTSTLKFQSAKRQSFYLSDGEWKDSGGTSYNNICVRAVTKNTEESFKVTYVCRAWRTRTFSVNGIAALPETEPGMTWELTCEGEQFDGTGITADTTVTAHYYHTDGVDHICFRDYRCVYCDRIMRPTVQQAEHEWQITNITTEPACDRDGAADVICVNCGNKSAIMLHGLGHIDQDDDGGCDRCGFRLRPEEPAPVEPIGPVCKYCGSVHTGVFGGIIQFFHNILYFFANLIG